MLGKSLPFVVFILITFSSCKKDQVIYEDNTIPPYEEIPTVVVQNYINRLYIDLIGREPIDTEMEAETVFLESENLNSDARLDLVTRLQFDTSPSVGDSSYNYAYFFKLYEDCKARMVEGISEGGLMQEYGLYNGNAILDSLNGNWPSYNYNRTEADKLLAVMNSREELMNSEITIDEMCRRLLFNSIYDQINMNSFNFVNASFDDLFFRFPTDSEFESAYNVIEFNQAAFIFGQIVQNKVEYLQVLTTNQEFDEGMVRWAYAQLLAREPNSLEVFELAADFSTSKNFQAIQQTILITDEYAGFD